MADLHEHHEHTTSKSMVPLLLTAFVILSILYLLAKGCTNRDETETSPHGAGPSHHTSIFKSGQYTQQANS